MGAAALVISIIALLISGLSAWSSWQQRKAAEDSAVDARRSADAAKEAVSYQRDEVERNRIRFEMEHATRDRFVLRNAGTDTAYGVRIDFRDFQVTGQPDYYKRFDGGHQENLLLPRTFGTTSTHIQISWHEDPDKTGEPRTAELLVE